VGILVETGRGKLREMSGSAARRSAHYKLGLDGNFRHIFSFAFDEVDKGLRRDLSHAFERLTNRGQPRVVECRGWDVVEAHDGDVLGDSQAGFAKRPDRADRRDIVVSEERSKGLFAGEKLLREGISDLGRGDGAVNLNGELRAYHKAELRGGLTNRSPSDGGIGAGGMTL